MERDDAKKMFESGRDVWDVRGWRWIVVETLSSMAEETEGVSDREDLERRYCTDKSGRR